MTPQLIAPTSLPGSLNQAGIKLQPNFSAQPTTGTGSGGILGVLSSHINSLFGNPAPATAAPSGALPTGTIGTSIAQSPAQTGSTSSQVGSPGVSITPQQQQILNSELGNIWNYGRNAFGTAAGQYKYYVSSPIAQLQSTQGTINANREANAFQNYQSMNAINTALRQGLQSGAIKIAALGGGGSSAGEEMARLMNNNAEAQRENQMQSTAEQNRQLDIQQGITSQNLQTVMNNLQGYRDSLISQIQSDVDSRLASLEQQAAAWGAPVPDESQKSAIINDGVAKLAAVDQWMNQQVGQLNPENWGQAQANAYNTLQSGGNYPGVPTPAQYSYSPTIMNPQTDVSGAPISNLPLFLKQNNQ